MGLIARHLEAKGLPTVSLSSAWSITAGANPPRAVYLNYPLGRTAGRPHQPVEQQAIVRRALRRIEQATEPGTIEPLPLEWPGAWKSSSRSRGDTRTERHDTPQWERPADEAAAAV